MRKGHHGRTGAEKNSKGAEREEILGRKELSQIWEEEMSLGERKTSQVGFRGKGRAST